MPQWNTISISGYHIREAGSTAVEEIAFTLANAKAYLRAARDAGLAVDVDRAAHLVLLERAQRLLRRGREVPRGPRTLWAHIVRDEFGSNDPRSQMLRFHTQTGGSTLTAQEPDNNVVRVTLQALAAVLGGTQSLHTNGKDEALALPTAESARLALRTQQIIGYESGVADVVDPLAGSYYVESLTAELVARRARADRRDRRARRRRRGDRKRLDAGADRRVGLPRAAGDRARRGGRRRREPLRRTGAATARRSPCSGSTRRSSANRSRGSQRVPARARRQRSVEASASPTCGAAARGRDNLMPLFLEAVDAGATLGEICDVLRAAFGTARRGRRVSRDRRRAHPSTTSRSSSPTSTRRSSSTSSTLGFRDVYRETIADQGVEAVGLRAGDAVIELLAPARSRLADRALPRRRADEAAPYRLSRRRHRCRTGAPQERRRASDRRVAAQGRARQRDRLPPSQRAPAASLIELCQRTTNALNDGCACEAHVDLRLERSLPRQRDRQSRVAVLPERSFASSSRVNGQSSARLSTPAHSSATSGARTSCRRPARASVVVEDRAARTDGRRNRRRSGRA